jgi:hypothetical protein
MRAWQPWFVPWFVVIHIRGLLLRSFLVMTSHTPPSASPLPDPALSTSHTAADPGFARAQRSLLREKQDDSRAVQEALMASG